MLPAGGSAAQHASGMGGGPGPLQALRHPAQFVPSCDHQEAVATRIAPARSSKGGSRPQYARCGLQPAGCALQDAVQQQEQRWQQAAAAAGAGSASGSGKP